MRFIRNRSNWSQEEDFHALLFFKNTAYLISRIFTWDNVSAPVVGEISSQYVQKQFQSLQRDLKSFKWLFCGIITCITYLFFPNQIQLKNLITSSATPSH